MNDSPMPEIWPGLPARAPAQITIVGLGPGSLGDLTMDAWRALADAPQVLLRTAHHPCVTAFPSQLAFQSCDDLYEEHADFGDVYAAIVDRVFALASGPQGRLVYAVPGHPCVGEATTPLILERAASEGVTTAVICGLSFIEPSYAAARVDPMDGAQIVDAMLLARRHHPNVEVSLPLLIAQVYARWLASDLKLVLLNAYPAEHPVWILRAASTPDQRVVRMPLHALDSHDSFDHLTSVYVPPQEAGRSFSDLQEIVAHLRAPEGCPWDREQTLESMCTDLAGECAEVLEAVDLDQGDSDNGPHIAEELGDTLMAATMMIQIATEEGRFQMGDATSSIVAKLIRRHPHVFGDTQVDSVDAVLVNWDAIKAQEKSAKGITDVHPLDGVPASLPALEKAREIQSKAQKAGLIDRHVVAHHNPKLVEAMGAAPSAEAIGSALWQIVALAKEHGIVAEDALRRFASAFRAEHGYRG